jgi:hypothetical protein
MLHLYSGFGIRGVLALVVALAARVQGAKGQTIECGTRDGLLSRRDANQGGRETRDAMKWMKRYEHLFLDAVVLNALAWTINAFFGVHPLGRFYSIGAAILSWGYVGAVSYGVALETKREKAIKEIAS